MNCSPSVRQTSNAITIVGVACPNLFHITCFCYCIVINVDGRTIMLKIKIVRDDFG
jgi:hypothetical protein